MTDMQRKWYKSILEKDIDAVNGASFLSHECPLGLGRALTAGPPF